MTEPDGNKPVYTEADRIDEEKRIRRLRRLVDFTLAYIAQVDMPLEKAHTVFEAARARALELFPDKEETFDLIITPRFRRIITAKYRMQ